MHAHRLNKMGGKKKWVTQSAAIVFEFQLETLTPLCGIERVARDCFHSLQSENPFFPGAPHEVSDSLGLFPKSLFFVNMVRMMKANYTSVSEVRHHSVLGKLSKRCSLPHALL